MVSRRAHGQRQDLRARFGPDVDQPAASLRFGGPLAGHDTVLQRAIDVLGGGARP
jgi:hypothetical protein